MGTSLHRIIHTFFDGHILARTFPTLLTVGLRNTALLSLAAMVIGLIVGLVVAMFLMAQRKPLRVVGRVYVDLFRGLPHIVSIYLIGQGLPLAGVALFGGSTYAYAALAIGIVEGAYMSEIFRSGIRGIDVGQAEASRSLGMSHMQSMRHVVLPQAARNILPALTGQLIIVIKNTALVFLLGLGANQRELFAIAQDASSNDASLTPLVASGILYLALTVPLTYLVGALDRHMGRSAGSDSAPVPVEDRVPVAVQGA
ncbi:MAG TPA: amino acid ABC transporter permease [Acidimicrobiales bacterium]|nr:amino acid ABC transporter permease [Acidimicrobiales bacterium]